LRVYISVILDNDHPIPAVGLYQLNPYLLMSGAWYVPAYIVSPDRQLAMTTVYEHNQLNRPGSPQVDKGVHGSTSAPPGIQNIIN
jgi:hypothetical protein